MWRFAVVLIGVAACSTTKFGKVVTEISVSPTDPRLLYVRTCDLQFSKKSAEQVEVGACRRYGVRRSAITPVPVVEASVVARENRILTGFIEREGGGAVVTTCRIGMEGDAWKLLDCVDTELATAPLEAVP
ncbi:MAG: hypothetical protein AB7T06_03395 [Kofleriaceae bacterium]